MADRSTTLGRLAELVGGHVQGDAATVILGAGVLSEVAAGEITLIDHADRLKRLATTQATAVVLPEKIANLLHGKFKLRCGCPGSPGCDHRDRRACSLC